MAISKVFPVSDRKISADVNMQRSTDCVGFTIIRPAAGIVLYFLEARADQTLRRSAELRQEVECLDVNEKAILHLGLLR